MPDSEKQRSSFGAQAPIEEQLRKEVEKALNNLAVVHQELEELCAERKQWLELEPGAEVSAPPPKPRVDDANVMYRREGRVYVKFDRAYQEVKRCFSIAAAMSWEFAALESQFETGTWSKAQEGFHPRLVAEQCVKTQLYTVRLLEMLKMLNPPDRRAGAGSVDRKPRGRPPDPVVGTIRVEVRRIRAEARSEGSHLTYEQLCERLDANCISLPPRAEWNGYQSRSQVYAQAPGALKRWLSETLAESP